MSSVQLPKEYDINNCPIRHILARISDKWSILVLLIVDYVGVIRFKGLQRTIPDISQKVLTSTLRTLEEDGLIHREVYAEVPPRVEYSVTERGKSLLPHFNSLITWAKENGTNILNDRQQAKR